MDNIENDTPPVTRQASDNYFTPVEIYNVIVDWVRENTEIGDRPIIRPFYPDTDYKSFQYPDNCVVIDNPPFSITAEIIRYYKERNIEYFLFTNGMTAFANSQEHTVIIVDSHITFDTNNTTKTIPINFISNLFGDIGILGAPDLSERIVEVENCINKTSKLKKYENGANVVSVSRIQNIIKQGISVKIPRNELHKVGSIGEKGNRHALFGKGFICSDGVERYLAAKEKAAKEKAAKKGATVIYRTLSAHEREIVERLNKVNYKKHNEKDTNTTPNPRND